MSIWSDARPPEQQRAYGAREVKMSEVTWNNTAPQGRSYNDHLRAEVFQENDPTKDGPPTFLQQVNSLGGGPIRTHSGLAPLLDACELGFTIDDSLDPDTAVIGRAKTVLRVTGLYA